MRKLTITLVTLIAILGLSVAYAERPSQKDATSSTPPPIHLKLYQQSKGSLELPDPLLNLKPIISEETLKSPEYQAKRKKRVAELMKAIEAIEDRGLRMKDRHRRRIADAALYAEEKTGVDAVMLVAMGRMESDFRGLILLNLHCKAGLRHHNCFADCGITQHHVRGSRAYVLRYCKKLIKKPRLSFLKSAEEVARHVNWCKSRQHQKWHHPMRRCVLNRYNQGTRYKTIEGCRRKIWSFHKSVLALGSSWRERRYPCKYLRRVRNESVETWYRGKLQCKRKLKKCVSRAAYWKKLTCFEYGARKLVRAKRSCRWCYNIAKISTRHYPLPPASTRVSAKPTPTSHKRAN